MAHSRTEDVFPGPPLWYAQGALGTCPRQWTWDHQLEVTSALACESPAPSGSMVGEIQRTRTLESAGPALRSQSEKSHWI